MMVHRLYVEKKENHEAAALLFDLRTSSASSAMAGLRVISRYDAIGADLLLCPPCFRAAPDNVYDELPKRRSGVRSTCRPV